MEEWRRMAQQVEHRTSSSGLLTDWRKRESVRSTASQHLQTEEPARDSRKAAGTTSAASEGELLKRPADRPINHPHSRWSSTATLLENAARNRHSRPRQRERQQELER